MNTITAYIDYRQLLKDYYEAAKLKNPYFSYQVFSQHAGISSRGFLYNVVTGKRKLSQSHVPGVAHAMKLSKSETDYFENLVAYSNARSLADKQRYFERMNVLKVSPGKAAKQYLVRKDQYRFYSQWYHAVVRSVIGLTDGAVDYEKLGRSLSPQITAAQAKRSVALLESLGLIKKGSAEEYRLADQIITTAPEVISLAVHNYHRQMLELADKALDEHPRDKRNFTGVTLGISASMYQQICREIELFRTHLLELAAGDTASGDTQGVYHLNLQFFPVSQPIPPRSIS